ncbi:MAG: hypothetical protein IT355_14460 [Gemmatimonadaceae bacterium]|nr:hypothetical protein [Gemmatimonadaceae bacterium]
MTWRGQVWHVFRKDCRNLWALYLLVAVAALINASLALPGGVDLGMGGIVPGMLFLYAAPAVTLAVVFSDNPATPLEFWGTLPLEPSAVAASKLLAIVTTMALVTGTFVALSQVWGASIPSIIATMPRLLGAMLALTSVGLGFGLSRGGRPHFIIVTSLYLSFGSWAAIIARRSTAAVDFGHRIANAVPHAAWLLAAGALVWALVRLYRVREASRTLQTAVGLALTAPGLMVAREIYAGPLSSHGLDVASVRAQAHWDPVTEDRLEIALTTTDDDHGRLRVLHDGVVIAELRDGTREQLEITGPRALERADGHMGGVTLRAGTPVVIGGQPAPAAITRYAAVWVNNSTRARREVHGVARFIVEGRLETYDVHEIDRFPTRGQRAALADGRVRTVRLSGASGDTAGPRIHLGERWLMLGGRDESPWPLPNGLNHLQLRFALLSGDGRQLLPLRSGVEGYPNSLGMPGFTAAQVVWTLRPAVWSVARPPVTNAWLDSAQVIVGAPVFRSAVRVRAVAEITPP